MRHSPNAVFLPSLPFKLIEVAADALGEHQAERRLGDRVPDEAALSEDRCELRIASCRPKQWHPFTTVRYLGELFVVEAEESAPPPHRFVYRLVRKPEGAVVRGVHAYHPHEVLQPPLLDRLRHELRPGGGLRKPLRRPESPPARSKSGL